VRNIVLAYVVKDTALGFAAKVVSPRPRSGLNENSPALQRWVKRAN
jgi:hypothetical protein